ncbi:MULTISPECIES: hypothetical protein [unclassified Endozoicomonas]|uniref:hypothetical protein n=1 Tax=unclassified Endozoicomonas TaxID=2644528 RepID=UPI002148E794|nr:MULTISPECIES: hypothetical protein [unclassified Endozoicomonas]
MTPGLYEQVRDLTLDQKKFSPGTKVGLNSEYELVEVVTSYKDWIVTHPAPVRLRNLLGSLIQSAHNVNQHLNLSDRCASTLEAKVAGELHFSILTGQVAEFLKTPACQIIRTREQLNKALQASVRAKKPEKNLQDKLKKAMHESFSRFYDFMDTSDLNQLVGFYRAALLEWLDEFRHQCACQGDLNNVYQATRNSVDVFTRNLITEIPPSNAGAVDYGAEAVWHGWGENAESLREMDGWLQAAQAEDLEKLLTKIRQDKDLGERFLKVREPELRSRLAKRPDAVARNLLGMKLSLDDHLLCTLKRQRKKQDPLYQILVSVAMQQSAEIIPRLPQNDPDMLGLSLYLKYPKVLARCKSTLVHQLIFLIQLSPEMEEQHIAVAAQHYLRHHEGLMMVQSPIFYKAARDTLLLSDFTLTESITLAFIKQYPKAALDIEPALFKQLLTHPELVDFWPVFITENATRLSVENWQQLFSGNLPGFHKLITRQISATPPLVCRFPNAFTAQLKSFLKNNPDVLSKVLKLPRQVENAGYRTLIAIAKSLSFEVDILPDVKPDPGSLTSGRPTLLNDQTQQH